MSRHWTEDDCIDRIYGIGPADEHLGECAECRALWQTFEARRATLRTSMEGAEARLAIPAILAPGARPWRLRFPWIPALAGAGAVAAALLVIHPVPNSKAPAAANTAVVSASDAQFFDEVAALDQSAEPTAARTAEALFETQEN